jgi:hypothetical protein
MTGIYMNMLLSVLKSMQYYAKAVIIPAVQI